MKAAAITCTGESIAATWARAVLVATGWDRHWRTPDYGAVQHPFLAEAAVEKLVAASVALTAIDSVNIDDTRGTERPAYTHLLARARRS